MESQAQLQKQEGESSASCCALGRKRSSGGSYKAGAVRNRAAEKGRKRGERNRASEKGRSRAGEQRKTGWKAATKAATKAAADDWNDTEVGEESEMDAAVKEEALLSVPPPRWLDEQTEIPSEEYNSYDYQLTDTLEYRVFLPHRAPNCGMTTTFSDLCDFLCEPLKQAANVIEKRRLRDLLSEPDKRAHDVREKRRGLVGSAELPIGLKIQLWAAKKEQEALLQEMDITLLSMQNCAAMNTIYDFLSTAWKRRLEKKAKRRSIILSTHCRGSKNRARGECS